MKKTIALILALAMLITVCGCGKTDGKDTGPAKSDVKLIDENAIKSENAAPDSEAHSYPVMFKMDNEQNNPLLTNIYCADPTSVEYNGRLYVFGTNDHEQYEKKGSSSNTYEKIDSFVVISTDDMVNWRYETTIDTRSIAPWIVASWAPSVVSRVEDDGKTHFYLYFSNSGCGVGVLTATDPAGPWEDPLNCALINAGMKGLTDCPQPFDPGVCIDDDGVGWLAFGGGRAKDGTDYMPGTSRICRLGADMISVDSDFVKIKAPYFFEASEMNFINGTYVYTFNTSWEHRLEWDNTLLVDAPPACSMCYMTSKTPLEGDSWEYHDYYLKNPGELGMEYGNNHTHLHKYLDNYYIIFHSMGMQKGLNRENLGFRSIAADRIEVDEENVRIDPCEATVQAADIAIKSLNPYLINEAETAFFTDCTYFDFDGENLAKCEGSNIIGLKGVDFGEGSQTFAVKVKGKGKVTLRFDSLESEPAAVLEFDCDDFATVYTDAKISGVKDYMLLELSGDFTFDKWQFD